MRQLNTLMELYINKIQITFTGANEDEVQQHGSLASATVEYRESDSGTFPGLPGPLLKRTGTRGKCSPF